MQCAHKKTAKSANSSRSNGIPGHSKLENPKIVAERADSVNRTRDLLITNQLLYLLSYVGLKKRFSLVRPKKRRPFSRAHDLVQEKIALKTPNSAAMLTGPSKLENLLASSPPTAQDAVCALVRLAALEAGRPIAPFFDAEIGGAR